MKRRNILDVLLGIEDKLKDLKTMVQVLIDMHRGKPLELPQTVEALLAIPDHLRRSLLALSRMGGKGSSSKVAEITGRARAVESGNLNQLVRLGYAFKYRVGRKVYYEIKREPQASKT